MPSDFKEALRLSPRSIRELIRVRKYKKLRHSYFSFFPKIMGVFPQKVEDDELVAWWEYYVGLSQSRPGFLRDGWLTGIDYGDF